jgi:hypothetical protein
MGVPLSSVLPVQRKVLIWRDYMAHPDTRQAGRRAIFEGCATGVSRLYSGHFPSHL